MGEMVPRLLGPDDCGEMEDAGDAITGCTSLNEAARRRVRSPSPALTDHSDHDMSAESAGESDDFSAYNYNDGPAA